MADQQIDAHWRTVLRGFLAAHVNQTLVLGDVIDRFAATIPLHHATRIWISQRDHQASMEQMREFCVRTELRNYPLTWDVERIQGRPWPRTGTFRPYQRICAGCGGSYFSRTHIRFCSSGCAATNARRLNKQALRDSPHSAHVQRLVARIDRAIEELEHLKDELLADDKPNGEITREKRLPG